MRARARMQRGFTLIEIMLGIAIFSILMTLAIPAFTQFLQNQKIKNAAETTMHGLTLARGEAVRRNQSIRFQFVSALTSGCALSTSDANWVVSVSDPTGACDSTPGGSTGPQIVQVKSAKEGTEGVSMTATGGSTVTFTGLGRMSGAGITTIDFSYPGGGTCQHAGGEMRCMRILVTTSGAAKICDPKVTDTTDGRYCS